MELMDVLLTLWGLYLFHFLGSRDKVADEYVRKSFPWVNVVKFSRSKSLVKRNMLFVMGLASFIITMFELLFATGVLNPCKSFKDPPPKQCPLTSTTSEAYRAILEGVTATVIHLSLPIIEPEWEGIIAPLIRRWLPNLAQTVNQQMPQHIPNQAQNVNQQMQIQAQFKHLCDQVKDIRNQLNISNFKQILSESMKPTHRQLEEIQKLLREQLFRNSQQMALFNIEHENGRSGSNLNYILLFRNISASLSILGILCEEQFLLLRRCKNFRFEFGDIVRRFF